MCKDYIDKLWRRHIYFYDIYAKNGATGNYIYIGCGRTKKLYEIQWKMIQKQADKLGLRYVSRNIRTLEEAER